MTQQADGTRPLLQWADQSDQRLLLDVVTATHRLSELRIFSDQGIAALLDEHPAAQLEVTATSDERAGRRRLRRGIAGDFDGQAWIQMIRRGRLCLRLRNVIDHHPALADLTARLADEMMPCPGGSPTDLVAGDLWICSPYTVGYFGVDLCPTMFWQIRGQRQTIYYPQDEPFVSLRDLKQSATRRETQPLDFEPAFDQRGTIIQQLAGDVLALPLHTPYRYVTGSTLSLTLAIHYQVRPRHPGRQSLAATDAQQRRIAGPDRVTEIGGPAGRANTVAVGASQQLIPPHLPADPETSFCVDPLAPHCIGDIAAAERDLLSDAVAAVEQRNNANPQPPRCPVLPVSNHLTTTVGTEN